MTAFMATLFGRMPIGWLQLTHNRTRMAAAIAGVAFANVLVFVQLGILGALNGTVGMTYEPIRADILISSEDANTLSDGSPLSRRQMYRALAVEGVAATAPLYLAKLDWVRPDGSKASMQVYGLSPDAAAFAGAPIRDQFPRLALPETALLDARTRGVDPEALGRITRDAPLRFEANGVALSAVGSFALGGGFSADGNLVVSDQTFLRLFPQRVAGTPSHIMVTVLPGHDSEAVSALLAQALEGEPLKVRPIGEAIGSDLSYQTTQRPTGVIFGFGVFIGVLVGIVIVYQVLATDVADHLREYATFKAMGYDQGFFLGIVFEEALILAVLGFVPGIVLASIIYVAMASATGLPIAMDPARAVTVLLGTMTACVVSGAIATRRLAGADPADLF